MNETYTPPTILLVEEDDEVRPVLSLAKVGADESKPITRPLAKILRERLGTALSYADVGASPSR